MTFNDLMPYIVGGIVLMAAGVVLRRLDRIAPPVPPPSNGNGALHRAENEFRDGLMIQLNRVQAQVDGLQTRVGELEQTNRDWQARDLLWRARELDWQRVYQMLVGQYNALVARLAPDVVVPAPPPLPATPAPDDSPLLALSGPSPMPRKLTQRTQQALVDILKDSRLSGGVDVRDNLLIGLPPGFRSGIARSAVAADDLILLVEAAAAFGGDPPCLRLLLNQAEDIVGTGSDAWTRLRQWRREHGW
jgi:hypothetical protein